ncbi:MAG: glucose-6-phosphate isomerase family protein [Acidimicrobiia bacterium]
MRPDLTPFTTLLRPDGTLEPDGQVVERRLSDMAGLYRSIPEGTGDPLIYTVNAIAVPETNSEIRSCTTVLRPGRIGDEYFMTKGHFHEVRERAEVYLGMSGEGRLVLATEDGDHLVEAIGPGTLHYVPGGWAHRSVNVGDQPLVFFAAYVGDAGHDYATVEDAGFPVRVLRGPDSRPRVVEDGGYGR